MEQMLHIAKIPSPVAKPWHKQGYSDGAPLFSCEATPVLDDLTFADSNMAFLFCLMMQRNVG